MNRTEHITTHTPGPWEVFKHAPWSVWANGDIQVAACRVMEAPRYYRERRGIADPEIAPYFERNDDIAAANARLIAAAPEMLEFVRRIASRDDGSMSTQSIREARALLAKIEGQS